MDKIITSMVGRLDINLESPVGHNGQLSELLNDTYQVKHICKEIIWKPF